MSMIDFSITALLRERKNFQNCVRFHVCFFERSVFALAYNI